MYACFTAPLLCDSAFDLWSVVSDDVRDCVCVHFAFLLFFFPAFLFLLGLVCVPVIAFL